MAECPEFNSDAPSVCKGANTADMASLPHPLPTMGHIHGTRAKPWDIAEPNGTCRH